MIYRFNTRAGVILCGARLEHHSAAIFTKMAVDTGARAIIDFSKNVIFTEGEE